ncbi:MAG: YraN family protein [Clostridia bacterium]|nr:YraN family protein [Clostridia bacterium]
MKQLNFAKGKRGEQEAISYLKKQGYKILDTNFSCPLGEIDIVAMHKGFLVIVEVKARSSVLFGRPSEAVDEFKQHKLIDLALTYQVAKGLQDMPLRFDVVEILDGSINLIPNAFGW